MSAQSKSAVYQTVRSFSLGTSSRTSVAVVGIKAICLYFIVVQLLQHLHFVSMCFFLFLHSANFLCRCYLAVVFLMGQRFMRPRRKCEDKASSFLRNCGAGSVWDVVSEI